MASRQSRNRDHEPDTGEALRILRASDQPLSSRAFVDQLVERLNCSTRVAEETSRILRRGGFVNEAPDPANRRRRLYTLSDLGRVVAAMPSADTLIRVGGRKRRPPPRPGVSLMRNRILELSADNDRSLNPERDE